MTPVTAGIYPGSAREDAEAMARGTATTAQIARARAALGLTNEQVAVLNSGGEITLTPDQATYLREFLGSQKSASLEDLRTFGDALAPELKGAAKGILADALQVGTNPGVVGPGFQGGLTQSPDSVRELLKRNLAKELPGDTEPYKRINQFKALVDVLERGDGRLRAGTDIDRGLLKQAAELRGVGGSTWDPDVVSDMLKIGGDDRPAVHSFLTGAGMEATLGDGEKFEKDHYLDHLFEHRWRDDSGFRSLLDNIGQDAKADNLEVRTMSGQDSRVLTQYMLDHKEQLMSLGQRDGGVVDSLGNALAPFIPSMAGVPDEISGAAGFLPLSSGDDMETVFAIIDGNETAAIHFNAAAAAQIGQLNQLYATGIVHGEDDPALATWAGRIDHAMSTGMNAQIEHQFEDASDRHSYKAKVYSGFVNATGGVLAAAPGGPVTYPALMVAAPFAQDMVIGGAPSLDQFGASEQDIITANHAGSENRRYYDVFEELVKADKIDPAHPDYASLFRDGKLIPYEELAHSGDAATTLTQMSGKVMQLTPSEFEQAWDNGHNSNWK
ncbi:hypothetical protein [Gordonia westfalica]|uniref:TPR repeat domain-containing protein n=1 Tax=Gordonia westfalica TaxID=158898 RepID=A0A1H2HGU3_9ACTN|nr:hypothetical protein [Gordonia westfalica]SDU30949.1 hypothetical protein SAMN04488548_134454 [Gordonia westfalica]